MSKSYHHKLESLFDKFSNLSGQDAKELDFQVFNPMGLHIVAGTPLLSGDNETFFNRAISGLKEINPSCVYYSDLELKDSSHLTLNSIIRTDCPEFQLNLKQDLQNYKKLFSTFSFQEFKIKPLKFCPNGIILWDTENHGTEVFKLRENISKYISKANHKFSRCSKGNPLMIDIIHTAFMKNIKGVSNWDSKTKRIFSEKLDQINIDLKQTKLYKEGISINSLNLIVEYIKTTENSLYKINNGYELKSHLLIKSE